MPPRHRIPTTDPLTRLRNEMDAIGRPGMAGTSRVGFNRRGRGGGVQSVLANVGDPDAADAAGAAQLLALSITGDSIASGGDYIAFDTIVAQHGFDGVTQPQSGQWVHAVGGVYLMSLSLEWDTYEGGGNIWLELDGALAAEGEIVPSGTGQQAIGFVLYRAEAESVGRVKVTQTSGSAQTCNATMHVGITDPEDLSAEDLPAPDLLWLDGDDLGTAGALASWTDKSGAGNTPTQATAGSQPTVVLSELNGRSVVRFDGTDDRLSVALASTSSQPVTIFAVAKNTDAGPFEHIRELMSCDPTGASTRSCEIGIQSETTPADEGKWIIGAAGGTNLAGPEAGTGWIVLEAVFDGADSLIAIDGGIVATGEVGAGAFEGTLHVGGRFTDYWLGDIAEIRAFTGARTEAVRDVVRADMQTKWAL